MSSMSCRENLVVCFDDCCHREDQFCNEKERRCRNCFDKRALCGNYAMPPACDLYCYKLQLPPQVSETAKSHSGLEIAGLVSMGLLVLLIICVLYVAVRRSKWLKRILERPRSQRTDAKKPFDPEGEDGQGTPLVQTPSVLDRPTHCDRESKPDLTPQVSEPETGGIPGAPLSIPDPAALGVSNTYDIPTRDDDCRFDNPTKSASTSRQTSTTSSNSSHLETDQPSSFCLVNNDTQPAQTAVHIHPNSGSEPGQTCSDNPVDRETHHRQTFPDYSASSFSQPRQTFPDFHVNTFNNVIPAEKEGSFPHTPTMGTTKPTTPYMHQMEAKP